MTTSTRRHDGVPPYGSYTSWETFLAYLKTRVLPLPKRLDSSIWQPSPFSGSTRSAIQSALVFFGLTGPTGETDPRLGTLAEGATFEEKREILGVLFQECYRPILTGVDLERATRGDVKLAFQAAGSGPGTSEKAVSFFVSFARDADVSIHSNLFSRARGSRTRRKSLTNRNDSPASPEMDNQHPKPQGVSENVFAPPENDLGQPEGAHPALTGLLSTLPKGDHKWTNADRDRFKLAINAVLDVIYPTIDDSSSRML